MILFGWLMVVGLGAGCGLAFAWVALSVWAALRVASLGEEDE